MNIKVLYLLDSLNRGGTETQALDVARNAKAHGLDLTVVSGQGGALEDEFRESGSDYVRLQRKLPLDLSLAYRLRAIIRERQIRIVQGHQAVDGLHLYLAALGLGDARKILSIEGYVADRKNRLTLKFLIPRMDANIYPSQGLREWLAEKDGLNTNRNSFVIINGADPKRLETDGKAVRREFGFPDDAIVLTMVGNFYSDPRKDHLTLVRALPRVFREFPNAHCLIAGGVEPGAEDKLAACKEFCAANAIAEHVHFLGPRNDVPEILAASDIFVLSSLHEGGAPPIAICEAMFAKVPVVASDIPPHIEHSDDGRVVAIFRTGDHNDLADRILKLLGSEASRRDLAERAYRHAMDNFSVDAHMRRLRGLYEKLLNS